MGGMKNEVAVGLAAVFLLAGCAVEANRESSSMNHANMEHGSFEYANTDNDASTKPSSLAETSDGKKVINIEAKKVHWMYNQQKMDTAWSYNGKVPGEEFRVKEGDRVGQIQKLSPRPFCHAFPRHSRFQ